VVDIKTTDDASPDAFGKSAANYGYDVGSAWYSDVLEAHYGRAPEHFVFIAVEKPEPHAIGIYFVEPEVMAAGRVIARRNFHRILEWRAANNWPDYGINPMPLRLPAWARRAA
jgi:hypothetical protein